MNKLKFFLLLLFPAVFFSQVEDSLQAKVQKYILPNGVELTYERPRFSDIYRRLPKNVGAVAVDAVSPRILPYTLGSVALTAAMLPLDPYLIREGRKLGEKVGFHENHTYHNLGPLTIIPGDAGSFIYFMGNGTTFMLISTGLATYGLLKNDYRAMSTSMQVVQSILLSGVFSQTLKRISGRESPFITAERGGWHSHWTLLPSFSEYQKHTSKYDAMPSGHLITGLAAWIVLAENYPEKKWIKPLGFSLMGLMTFEMVQSGVHWASDYPVALVLGYLIGKTVVKNAVHRSDPKNSGRKENRYTVNFSSSYVYGQQVAGVTVTF